MFLKKREGGRRRRRRGGGGVTRGRRQFWVSICPLIFKQQAGGVLVTDKEAGLSSHSLTSTHSALLSGRHLESRKQLRARRGGGGARQQSGVGRFVFVCACTCNCPPLFLGGGSIFFLTCPNRPSPSAPASPHPCAPLRSFHGRKTRR